METNWSIGKLYDTNYMQEAAISDIIANYPASLEEITNLINSLGFKMTLDEVTNEYNNRL